jgi:hypothetical protein
MGALSRVLQDDYKRSIELTLPLCTLFCVFSKYSDMHYILTEKGIGATTVKVIQLELERYDMRAKKMKECVRVFACAVCVRACVRACVCACAGCSGVPSTRTQSVFLLM